MERAGRKRTAWSVVSGLGVVSVMMLALLGAMPGVALGSLLRGRERLPELPHRPRHRSPAADDSALAKLVRGFRYRVALPPGGCAKGLLERITGFLDQLSFVVEREGKEKTTRKDVRPYVEGIALDRETGKLEMTLLFSEGRTVRPAEILTHALGLDPETVRRAGMVKTETILAK